MDAATVPIAMTTPSPKLTPVPWCRGRLAPCTLWILGHWAGPATREVKWSEGCGLYFILLLPNSISLLHIITWPVITYYYYFVITLLLRHLLLRTITILLLHHYYIIITYYYHSLFSIITFSVITLLLHNYYVLLHIHYYLLLRHDYYTLLHYYYIIITSLLVDYSQLPKLVIMSSYYILCIIPVFIVTFLLPIIIIITHYYMLPTLNGATCRCCYIASYVLML